MKSTSGDFTSGYCGAAVSVQTVGEIKQSCSGTFSQCGACLCWPHTSMNSFSAEPSLGLEENVQLLPTFLKRRSRWSARGAVRRPCSRPDRWLISAPRQEDMLSTPLAHTQTLSSPPHTQTVCAQSDRSHTHTPRSQTQEVHPGSCLIDGSFGGKCQWLFTVSV